MCHCFNEVSKVLCGPSSHDFIVPFTPCPLSNPLSWTFPQSSWPWSWIACMAACATQVSTPTRSLNTPKGRAEWPFPISRATSLPSAPDLCSCSTETLTRGWAIAVFVFFLIFSDSHTLWSVGLVAMASDTSQCLIESLLPLQLRTPPSFSLTQFFSLCPPRWKWSPTCWTTSCAMSVRVRAAAASLRPSSAPTSPVCSTIASSAGPTSTRAPAASSTSRLWRKEPTGRARSTSAGTREGGRCGSCLINLFHLLLSYQYNPVRNTTQYMLYISISIYLL